MPLMSGSVQGQFGKLMVFHRSGKVIPYQKPHDKKSPSQVMSRAIMGDIARELHQVSFYKRKDIRLALHLPRVKYDRNWIASITQYLMLNDFDQFDAGYNAWLAMDSEFKSQWAMYDPGRNLKLSSGGCFFAVALGTYHLCYEVSGVGVIPQPIPENALQVSQAWNT